MKIDKTLIIGNMLLFLALAGTGWMTHSRDSSVKPTSSTQASDKRSASPKKSSRFKEDDYSSKAYARKRVAQIMAIRDPKERQRATLELAQSIPLDQIAKWIREGWFGSSEGFDLSLFNQLLKDRLETESPIESLKLAGYIQITDEVLNMAIANPEGLVAYFKEVGINYNNRQLLEKLAEKDPKLALDAIIGFCKFSPVPGQSGSVSINELKNTLKNIELAQPGLIESQLDQIPLSLRKSATSGIFSAKMSKDWASTITELSTRPDGCQIFKSLDLDEQISRDLLENAASLPASYRSFLGQRIQSIAYSDPMRYANMDYESLGFSSSQTKTIHQNLLWTLANKNPEEALKHLDWAGDDKSWKKNVIENMFARLKSDSSSDKGNLEKKGADLLAQISDPELKATAEAALAKQVSSMEGSANNTPAIESPEDGASIKEWAGTTFAQLKDINDSAKYQLVAKINSLSSEQQQEVVSTFSALSAEDKLPVLKTLLNNYGSFSPSSNSTRMMVADGLKSVIENGDLEMSNVYGTKNGKLSAYSAISYINQWAQKDSQVATQWIRSLPSGEAKTEIQRNFINNMARNDYEAAERWIKTLPAAEQQTLKPTLEKNRMK